MSDARVILSTVPDAETARDLARHLIEARLAACVNTIGGVRSTYRWEGSVTEDDELLLVIKTAADRVADLTRSLADRHPYEVPEIVVLPVVGGGASYLQWVTDETRGNGR